MGTPTPAHSTSAPDSHPYPCAEIEDVVTQLDDVRHAAAFAIPGQWVNDARIVLLLFVESPSLSTQGHKSGKANARRTSAARKPSPAATIELHHVKTIITREMGAKFLPDRIEVIPLRPRFLKDGTIDRAWCRSQYLTGTLRRKARDEMFRLIGRLGYMFAPAK